MMLLPTLLDERDPREGQPDFEGYCITLFEGSVWLTQELLVTPDYAERGIWKTWAEVTEAKRLANIK